MKNSLTYEYYKFYVNVVAEEITVATFDLATAAQPIYPNTENLFNITFTLANGLPDDWSFVVNFTDIQL
jgi:hypothetical protein